MSSPARDNEYYCHDLVLQIENTLFRVPRFIFVHSQVFQDMFSVPQGESCTIEGTRDDHPIILPSYRAEDFRQLMRVLLPQQHPPAPLSSEGWISVLTLANAWEMESVRATAIKHLDKYGEDDPMLRLIVVKRFGVPTWFVPALNSMCQRTAPLNSDDLSRLIELGNPIKVFQFMLKIGQVRETFDQAVAKNVQGSC